MSGMRRVAPAIPVTPRLFRHFAIVTVVLTSCLALFADGENQAAIAESIKTQQTKSAVRKAEQEKLGSRKLIATKTRTRASNNDVPVDSARPPASGGGYDPYELAEPEFRDFRQTGRARSAGAAGYAAVAYQDAGSDMAGAIGPDGGPMLGPQTGPAKGPQKGKAKRPQPPTQEEIEAMLAASRERSGQSGSGVAFDDSEELEEE
jgi:hypothetical protein